MNGNGRVGVQVGNRIIFRTGQNMPTCPETGKWDMKYWKTKAERQRAWEAQWNATSAQNKQQQIALQQKAAAEARMNAAQLQAVKEAEARAKAVFAAKVAEQNKLVAMQAQQRQLEMQAKANQDREAMLKAQQNQKKLDVQAKAVATQIKQTTPVAYPVNVPTGPGPIGPNLMDRAPATRTSLTQPQLPASMTQLVQPPTVMPATQPGVAPNPIPDTPVVDQSQPQVDQYQTPADQAQPQQEQREWTAEDQAALDALINPGAQQSQQPTTDDAAYPAQSAERPMGVPEGAVEIQSDGITRKFMDKNTGVLYSVNPDGSVAIYKLMDDGEETPRTVEPLEVTQVIVETPVETPVVRQVVIPQPRPQPQAQPLDWWGTIKRLLHFGEEGYQDGNKIIFPGMQKRLRMRKQMKLCKTTRSVKIRENESMGTFNRRGIPSGQVPDIPLDGEYIDTLPYDQMTFEENGQTDGMQQDQWFREQPGDWVEDQAGRSHNEYASGNEAMIMPKKRSTPASSEVKVTELPW